LLQRDGLAFAAYRRRFGSDPCEDLPQLAELDAAGLAMATEAGLRLTETGLERSDAIGPWLYSAKVRELMEDYAWR
jgi:oxygen-independent coproporphyrinogen-3 oxidase